MSIVEKTDPRALVDLGSYEPASRSAIAIDDLAEGLGKSWIWTTLALQDIRIRYRGSILGPFWFTLSTAIMVVAMGAIYSRLLNSKLDFYIPYLTTGLVTWQFVSNTITESCQTFTANRSVILQVPMPFSLYAYRLVCRNVLILGHNFILVPFVLVLFHVPVSWHTLLFPLGVLLTSFNALWFSLLLGMTCTRFLDIPPIVASFLQLVFFITPIFWPASALGRWQTLAECNPLFAVIDVMRSPLLGIAAAPYSWWIAIATVAVGGSITFAFFARFRSRITYWI